MPSSLTPVTLTLRCCVRHDGGTMRSTQTAYLLLKHFKMTLNFHHRLRSVPVYATATYTYCCYYTICSAVYASLLQFSVDPFSCLFWTCVVAGSPVHLCCPAFSALLCWRRYFVTSILPSAALVVWQCAVLCCLLATLACLYSQTGMVFPLLYALLLLPTPNYAAGPFPIDPKTVFCGVYHCSRHVADTTLWQW